MNELIKKLEAAALRRDPQLAAWWLPGLPEERIRKRLEKAEVKGVTEPIVDLFSWKNGTQPQGQVKPEPCLFPRSVYRLADLGVMITHFNGFEEISAFHPGYAEVIGRYFPLFWNGSMDYLALDLSIMNQGRVVVIENIAEKLVREAYFSWENFLQDAIRANETNELLTCFQPPKRRTPPPVPDAPAAPTAPADASNASGPSGPVNLQAGPKILPVKGSPLTLRSSAYSANPDIVPVKRKPIPPTENTLALRTDFTDEDAWYAICDEIQDPDDEFGTIVDFVSDPAFDGLTADQLPALLPEKTFLTFAFIIDRLAMFHPDHPVLVVDLKEQPGRSFRVVVPEMGNVESNLSIANMQFHEFADAADVKGVFRGF